MAWNAKNKGLSIGLGAAIVAGSLGIASAVGTNNTTDYACLANKTLSNS